MQQNDLMKSLVEAFLYLAPQEGLYPTYISNITLVRVDHSTQPVAVLQEPSIVLVIQGVKRGYIGKDTFQFQQGQCLLISIAIPFDCDTLVENEPMLAIAIKFEAQMMADLATKMDKEQQPSIDELEKRDIKLSCGLNIIDMNTVISEVALRLLNLLRSKQDTAILGEQIKRELIYRVLQAGSRDLIENLSAMISRNSVIYTICEIIQRDYYHNLTVQELAKQAGMSVSLFHQAFKKVTNYSPLQYIKITRLHKARDLILNNQMGVAEAAYQVGYVSASQFSREFKRLFGVPPKSSMN
ncbi:AraC family transcriptional regulator [Acinetobacter nosocomialis]|uniref:AraC family transcriptional regulator n=1 Tax=Acinetobacter nosocomialis TaxID=106654 RepID=UPI000B3DABE8|nr:AraC family transcriptional regulator [Acinetobacter nosocomialis]MBD0444821.1 AraC family transcriptional regulator [Acinetobacter nosocomialis]MDQ9040790.1 AraC family transcriptional regulator [Acinetobacter nosocomialis]MDR9532226.1 AraC family transcriptional regulator [Acinetobacter nosocomialis]OUT25614.1 DNA-binding domain-containing protein [Acinetobacter nosocomialis P020]PSE17772.1 AraC family transcriptional regulator [Acinetobacter nosocomialis]